MARSLEVYDGRPTQETVRLRLEEDSGGVYLLAVNTNGEELGYGKVLRFSIDSAGLLVVSLRGACNPSVVGSQGRIRII